MARTTTGYFNKKKVKPQWEEQDIRNKDETKTTTTNYYQHKLVTITTGKIEEEV